MKKYALITICLALSSAIFAQSGLWEVKHVAVGTETMTPVAKWFDIGEDGEVLGGNGRMINIEGTYTYNSKTSDVMFTAANGVPDEYGAFKVVLDGKSMTWQREEEGMDVIVSLERVDAIPKAPWDKCVGSWIDSTRTSIDQLFMGWDRRYRLNSEDAPHSGTWYIHAHQPQLTLYRADGQWNEWTIDFPNDSTMIWSSEFGEERIFRRE